MKEKTELEVHTITREAILRKHFAAKVELINFFGDDSHALANQIEKLTFQTAKLLESIGERFTYDTEYYLKALCADHKGTS